MRVGANDFGVKFAPIIHEDADAVSAFDYVVVGENVTFFADDEAGALSALAEGFLGHFLPRAETLGAFGPEKAAEEWVPKELLHSLGRSEGGALHRFVYLNEHDCGRGFFCHGGEGVALLFQLLNCFLILGVDEVRSAPERRACSEEAQRHERRHCDAPMRFYC